MSEGAIVDLDILLLLVIFFVVVVLALFCFNVDIRILTLELIRVNSNLKNDSLPCENDAGVIQTPNSIESSLIQLAWPRRAYASR